jgi:hypothetical protein
VHGKIPLTIKIAVSEKVTNLVPFLGHSKDLKQIMILEQPVHFTAGGQLNCGKKHIFV